jgi:hypothetical protein
MCWTCGRVKPISSAIAFAMSFLVMVYCFLSPPRTRQHRRELSGHRDLFNLGHEVYLNGQKIYESRGSRISGRPGYDRSGGAGAGDQRVTASVASRGSLPACFEYNG